MNQGEYQRRRQEFEDMLETAEEQLDDAIAAHQTQKVASRQKLIEEINEHIEEIDAKYQSA